MRNSAEWLTCAILVLSAATAFGQEHHDGHADHQRDTKGSMPPPTMAPPATPFSEDIAGLPEARPMETVELHDGASYTLTAAPVKQKVAGQWVRRLAYNGSVPGPVLKVKQGATVRITLKNATDTETTLHPHGLRVDDKNDGVVGVGQAAVAPGQSHDYVLKFIDAGVFWYHPHVREDYAQDLGLYGNFWVVAQDAEFFATVHREVPLLLDDISVKGAKPYFREKVTHTLMGRFGDVMLVNGQDDYRLAVTEGEVIRFFITNTANARTINFALPGARMKLVGGDNGLFECEAFVDHVTIAPSERYIVEAQFPNSGTVDIVNDKPNGRTTLGRIDVRGGQVKALLSSFDTLRSPAAAAQALATVKGKLELPVRHEMRLTLAMDHAALPISHGHAPHAGAGTPAPGAAVRPIEWDDEMPTMNLASDDRNVVWKLVDPKTGRENMAIDWTFKKGEFAKIRIVNDAQSMHPMQHPIHFHGLRFVVAAINGRKTDNLVWKDSVLVAPGETVDLVLEASHVGRWMAHCHIAEHLGAGMMLGFQVLD